MDNVRVGEAFTNSRKSCALAVAAEVFDDDIAKVFEVENARNGVFPPMVKLSRSIVEGVVNIYSFSVVSGHARIIVESGGRTTGRWESGGMPRLYGSPIPVSSSKGFYSHQVNLGMV